MAFTLRIHIKNGPIYEETQATEPLAANRVSDIFTVKRAFIYNDGLGNYIGYEASNIESIRIIEPVTVGPTQSIAEPGPGALDPEFALL